MPTEVKNGLLHCQCGVVGLPQIIEVGITRIYEPTPWKASGVITADVSTETIELQSAKIKLRCRSCREVIPIPKEYEIDWVFPGRYLDIKELFTADGK